eukprot:Lithocolla_globosa_v1_NODE_822_length_3233_cov_120.909062.p2 type:complete len:129 gc:universal NODE_822_length_3233_cov_120.909062:2324-2710(+)
MDAELPPEEQYMNEGFESGLVSGEVAGMKEGFSLGCQKGYEHGLEAGFYAGCVLLLKQECLAVPEPKSKKIERVLQVLGQIEGLLNEFRRTPMQSYETFEKIQSKFKLVNSMLNRQLTFKSTQPSVNF